MHRPRFHALHFLSAVLLAWIGLLGMTAWLGALSREPPRDTLVVALPSEPRSLDPHVTISLDDFRVLGNVFEGLVRYRPGSLDVEPALARTWSISEDGLRYTFHLRSGVRFHDGTSFDASVVKFNFDRLRDPAHPFRSTGPFPLAFFFDVVRAIHVHAPDVVVFELHEPFAPFLSNLAYPIGFMISPRSIAARDSSRHPVGTGPFRFVEWLPGRRIVLERANLAERGVRRVLFRPIVDPMTRIAELRAGQLDLVTDLAPDHAVALRDTAEFVVHERVGPHLFFLLLHTAKAPFSDVRVRRAVMEAIDREAISEHLLAKTAIPAYGPIPAAFEWAIAPDEVDGGKEPRSEVREAGARGMRVRLAIPRSGPGMLEPVEVATAIQADLRAIGLSVEIATYEWNTFLMRVNEGLGDDLEMAAMAWMTNDPDTLPYLVLRSQAAPPNGFNSGYVDDPELDALIERGRRTVDRAERSAIYRTLDRLVRERAPIVPIATGKQTAVTHRRVEGLSLEPSFALRLAEVRKR